MSIMWPFGSFRTRRNVIDVKYTKDQRPLGNLVFVSVLSVAQLPRH